MKEKTHLQKIELIKETLSSNSVFSRNKASLEYLNQVNNKVQQYFSGKI